MVEPVNGGSGIARFAGSCLYIAGNGRRCPRPALVSGFCSRHDPDAKAQPMMPILRVAAAVLMLLVFLWPLIADLLREIRGWGR
ncbi:MAG TPA: hypothetical protein VEJ39_05455 [Candidatus Acidoferrales bacterium]|nr:hypothetical protein [Candidatus Acidoferrales bacterium]